jgi:uncharacterized delta-60 repeat protein
MRRVSLLLLVAVLGMVPDVAADGMLDPSFGNGGLVVTSFPGGPFSTYDSAAALVIMPDGRAVAAGGVGDIDGPAMGAARYLPSGALDTTFGANGWAWADCPNVGLGAYPRARDAVLQPDGGTVLFGTCPIIPAGGMGFLLARFTLAGTLDPSFGTGGRVVTQFPGVDVFGEAGVLQPDGRIVAVGYTFGSPMAIAAARYNPNGSLDATFGTAGLLVLPLAQAFTVSDVALQPDGKLVIGGRYGAADFGLVRLLPSGAPDPSFDGDGLATANFGGTETSESVVVLPDARIVLGGTHNADFALVRFLPGGSVDATFGAGGLATGSNGGPVFAGEVIRLPNDNLLIAGTTNVTGAASDFLLARFLPGGALDTSFGAAGFLRTDFSGSQDGCSAVALAAPDRILTAGRVSSPPGFPGDFGLARYIATTPVELLAFEVE